MIYRRFGYIHARLLMHRQDELRELEDELEEMDKRDAKSEERKTCLQSRDVDEHSGAAIAGGKSRSSLLDQIEEKAMKYGTSSRNLKKITRLWRLEQHLRWGRSTTAASTKPSGYEQTTHARTA